MALHFPNPSRNYNPVQHCVCFWGHDAAFEVSFQLDQEALHEISPFADQDEASLLHIFDVNLVRIQEAATAAYARDKNNFQRLSAADFAKPARSGNGRLRGRRV